MSVRRVIDTTRATERPAVESRHVRFCPGFIEENELFGIDESLRNPKVTPTLDHVRARLFRGNQRLFFNRKPNWRRRRHTVDSTTDTLSIGINCIAVIPGRAAT